MHELGRGRRRNGAIFWGIFQNAEHPDDYIETFMIASWLEHLRQHERVSRDDQRLQSAIEALLNEGHAPVVRHYIGGQG
jgi:hypothetical protein